mmetsp:Transcript_9647/g.21744  ORF Transcript_9647/g.21744 Transcript_9647/m.21744 type:complete len:108 (+) Transcript_9647:46-369(+)
MNSFTLLVALIVVAACSAFAPNAAAGARESVALNLKLNNAYARGGKASWEFEQETMYVEEPKKAAPKKKVVAKKTVVKAAAPKKKAAAAPKAADAIANFNPLAKFFN